MRRFEPLILIIVALALGLFVCGVWQAGVASLACDAPGGPMPPCDAQGYPQIDPVSTSIVPSINATLATFFGAAIGLARWEQGSPNPRGHGVWRWGAVLRRDDDRFVIAQTVAGYVYFFGLLLAAWFFVRDLKGEAGGTLDSPFTHLIIKTCATSLLGTIVGVLALVLGVKPKNG